MTQLSTSTNALALQSRAKVVSGEVKFFRIMGTLKKNFCHLIAIATLVSSASFVHAAAYVFWANNDYDRGNVVDGNDFEQDDLELKNLGQFPAYQRVPDCNYKDAAGHRVIPCARDLEDFTRLWISGVDSNLVAALPANSTLTLSWINVEGEPTIDLFAAADPDGGVGFHTNAAIAAAQIDSTYSPHLGRIGPGEQIQFTKSTWRDHQFIWCGVRYGSGGLTLTIADGTGKTLAQATVWIAIVDIKQMYERWTVGDAPSLAPMTNALIAGTDIPQGGATFQYPPSTDTTTPYILFVHGWNMKPWEKDRFAETAFKRLYWQGYQGRFGVFRWPTGNGLKDVVDTIADARNYDNSEFTAFLSAKGLLNKLTDLNAQYPNRVYLMAHSMGNVVAGEALRLAGNSQVANTYVAMQGAVAAHAYDSTTTTRSLGIQDSGTPNRYANYYADGAPCYFNGSAGAGAYVNFYNTNDYALSASLWQLNQNLKPDGGVSLPYPGYYYSAFSGFYKITGAGANNTHSLGFPTNTYEIFAYGDEARCYALGAQPGVGGAFAGNQVDLLVAPHNFGREHKYHSGQFRSDNMQRAPFWNAVLLKMQLKGE